MIRTMAYNNESVVEETETQIPVVTNNEQAND